MVDVKGYQVLDELGRGSTGVVYRARDKQLDRLVALKVLHERFLSNADVLKRFDREARLSASLSNHPNIVTVFSAGCDEGGYHIAMEYVDGGSISSLLAASGAQKTRYAVAVVAQVADALAHAHGQGVVHRDIKPNNILLDGGRHPKVADFGLARLMEAESDLTAENVRVGTFRYMSPEQCSFEPATPRSDIYSLGVVFYEMLSGKHAFTASNPLALVHQIVKTPFPKIQEVRPDVPQDIALILEKMVAGDPDDRYFHAGELSADLRSWCDTGRVGPTCVFIPPLPLSHSDTYSSDDSEPILDKIETPSQLAPNLQSGPECIVHFVESDRLWAEWIKRMLADGGYDAELRTWEFKNSDDAVRQLSSVVHNSATLVAVLSPCYLTALLGDRTWTQAFVDGTVKGMGVCVRHCIVPRTLSLAACVDASVQEPDEAKRILLAEVFRRRGKPRSESVRVEKQWTQTPTPTTLRHSIWNVPCARASYLSGRGAYFQQIQELLAQGGLATLVPRVPEGEGLGLTQIAAEYAYCNESQYSFVWWIRAEKKMERRLGYAGLAKAAHLGESTSREIGTQVAGVKAWLAQNDGWLLVFDDVASFSDIEPYLLENTHGHVLITSPSTTWPTKASPVAVGALERGESVELLYQMTKERNEGAAAALADALGDVPLALTLAAAYICSEKIPLDEYYDRFIALHKALWGKEDLPKEPRPVVTTAVGLTIELLSRTSPEAVALLCACAYFAPYDVRLARLCSAAKCFPLRLRRVLQTPSKLNAAIEALERRHMIASEKDTFYIHAVVQKLLVEWLEADRKTAANPGEVRLQNALKQSFIERASPLMWLKAGVRFIWQVFPQDCKGLSNLDEAKDLLCHALTVVQHAERRAVDPQTTSSIWCGIGCALREMGEHKRACSAFEKAIVLHKKAYGQRHKGLHDLYMHLARIRWSQSDLKGARTILEDTLALNKEVHGEIHVDVALVHHDIGNVLAQMGDYAGARQQYRKALVIDQKIGGKNKEAVARDLKSLGLATQELGDLVGAHEHYREALEISEKIHGPKHREVSAVVKNLAALMQRMGDPMKARTYYERAIAIDTEIEGENHPPLAQYYNNLGIISQGLGDPETALVHYKQALRINESVYGPRHPKTAINLVNIANLLRLQKHTAEAMKMYERAVNIFAKVLGEKHHMTMTAQKNLEKLRRPKGKAP
jgi:serine/threonine protein kinase/tetratricopeptide (TPR) repeat protein